MFLEAGKQVLNSIKQSDNVNLIQKNIQKTQQAPKENSVSTLNMKKIITVTPEEFLAMTTNGGFSNNITKPVSKFITIPKNNVKRIVMKKNKTTPITATINVSRILNLLLLSILIPRIIDDESGETLRIKFGCGNLEKAIIRSA